MCQDTSHILWGLYWYMYELFCIMLALCIPGHLQRTSRWLGSSQQQVKVSEEFQWKEIHIPISPWELSMKGWTTWPRTYCQQSNGCHSVFSLQALWVASVLIGLRWTTAQITGTQWEDYFVSLKLFHADSRLRWIVPLITGTQWEDYIWPIKSLSPNSCSSILKHIVFKYFIECDI